MDCHERKGSGSEQKQPWPGHPLAVPEPIAEDEQKADQAQREIVETQVEIMPENHRQKEHRQRPGLTVDRRNRVEPGRRQEDREQADQQLLGSAPFGQMAEQSQQEVDREVGFDMRVEREVGLQQVGVGLVEATPDICNHQMIGPVLRREVLDHPHRQDREQHEPTKTGCERQLAPAGGNR